MVSTASTNALPMNCPWRNKLSPSPRPRRGVHIVKVCPVDNIYLLCYTATCLSSIAGAGYSSPFPSHQGVHTRWFGRALEWHSRGRGFDPLRLHQKNAHFGYHRQKCRWYRAFRGGSPPQISQLKQKIQTGGSQKLAGSEPQNSIEIHSVLFEMRFFKKGAVFIFRKRALNWHCKVNMKK